MRIPHGLYLQLLLLSGLSTGAKPALPRVQEGSSQTTDLARKLVLQRLEWIASTGECRRAFDRDKVDLDYVRSTALKVRFYDAEGPEGDLRFSDVVGKPASPDERLRDLARGLSADAFVLGYQDGHKYIRTRQVVLNRGYFRQSNPQNGTWRLTTEDEKQALLLHEILHIALDRDDDDLTRRGLCPLRLLASCPHGSAVATAPDGHDQTESPDQRLPSRECALHVQRIQLHADVSQLAAPGRGRTNNVLG
jgi:hypothetical protein